MTILVVEDDPYLRPAFKTMLEKDGFQIVEAGDGIDGYKIIQEIGGSIDLLLTDINMPRMDGLALAQSAAELYPRLPILLMTGQSSTVQGPIRSYMVLKKPFLRHDLVHAVRKVIAAAICPEKARFNPTDRSSTPSRSELTEHWRTHAQKAKERYIESSRHFETLLVEQKQGLIPAPDGSLAIQQARMQESVARREYMRVLRILTDLIISGEMPVMPSELQK